LGQHLERLIILQFTQFFPEIGGVHLKIDPRFP
jgi:hypothetical protein